MSDKRIPNAAIRRVWLDKGLTTREAASEVGLARSTVWKRAKALGLPQKKTGPRVMVDDALFAELWNAGVLGADIAEAVGCNVTSVAGVARRIGLPHRKLGRRPKLRLAEYRQSQAIAAMVQTARHEEAQLHAAEMKDFRGRRAA